VNDILKRSLLLLAALTTIWATDPQAQSLADSNTITPPTPAAIQTFQIIDAMDVETHWLAERHVDWETGRPDGARVSLFGRHTHCSAFVAAAAERLGVYILRPPDHPQLLLANAQYDWLTGPAAARRGWTPLSDAVEAQNRANLGDLVIVVHRNPRNDMPGHIAIVRPETRTAADIEQNGPQITQAGGTNYRSTTASVGFRRAWENRDVRFYAHAIPRNAKAQ
jgi:hypothetical protein